MIEGATGRIIKVSGPLVVAEGMAGSRMYDVVRVGEARLIGEIIELTGDQAAIQVYEQTAGIGPGEPVYPTYQPLSVELGPGLVESIFDGIQRPLTRIREQTGDFIARGIELAALDRERLWKFSPTKKLGDEVVAGDILGEIPETSLITHRVMVPPGVSGRLLKIEAGEYRVTDTVAVIETEDGEEKVQLIQRWPVRRPRPYKEKLAPTELLSTGQRVIDSLFPLGRGGTACCPGPFGSGKTVIQHQLAKWCDANLIVYIGCGERGNEMTDVLMEFPKLKDPKTGEPLMRRTILVANTSNMPVAARDASVYTGITIAEYYRDMGYSVAVMADSTSRWAEAMREISGRLEEMPGEEGYPAYLGTRVAEFYERAGRVVCLGADSRQGDLSVIGAVSPPGGDLSDPVVQATLRVVKVFWSLEDRLAYQRHFPAISWLNSYSLYQDQLKKSLSEQAAPEFVEHSREAMKLLEEEAELQEIVRLIGVDALSPQDRLVLLGARVIREDFLYQNAFHELDTYTSLKKQAKLLELVLYFYQRMRDALGRGVSIRSLEGLKVREEISRARYIPEAELDSLDKLKQKIDEELGALEVKP